MEKGIFITIEGPDGAGKSTQINFIKQFFEGKGKETVITREPGGTQIGEKIRQVILDKENIEMSPKTEALLYAASRAQHVEQLIKPSLADGKVVICDRYMDSSIVYQGYGRNLGKAVEDINIFAIDGLLPEITFLLKVDPKVGSERRSDAEKDRLEMESLTFHQRVYEGYLSLEKLNPQRIIGVDASLSIEEIKEEIRTHLEKIWEKHFFTI